MIVRLGDGRAARVVESWQDGRRFDGRNNVSCYTGEEFRGADLGRTESGLWILLPWSSWQGERPSAYEVTPSQAAGWFAAQGLELPPELATAVV